MNDKSGPGEDFLSPTLIAALAVGLIAMISGIGVGLVKLWPDCDWRGSPCPKCSIESRASLPKPSESAAEMQVLSVTPSQVGVSGCNEVQVEGKGFLPGARVRFGGTECEAGFGSSSTLTAIVPPHAPGKVTVSVSNPDGRTASRPDALAYACPAPEEWKLLSLVLLAGALGGALHSLRSLYWYVGNRDLRRSWVLMYMVLPFSSAAMALVFYLLIRGGFWSPSAQSDSYVALVAVGTLVGMFSVHASLKLKQIADAVLTRPEEGKNAVPQQAGPPGAPKIRSVRPNHGPRAGGQEVRITGTAFPAQSTVTIGGQDAPVKQTSATLLVVTTPAAGAATTGTVDVVVIPPGGPKLTARRAYTYDAGLAVTGITPTRGPAAGNQAVTISGSGLANGTTVTIGGRDATVTSRTDAAIQAMTPPLTLSVPGQVERVDVVVTDGGGVTQKLAAGYEYEP